MAKSFGRDEMNAMLGGAGHESSSTSASLLFRPPSIQQPQVQRRRANKDKEPDIASLTPAETAALLIDKTSQESATTTVSSRYRTKKVLAHHELANELLLSSQKEYETSKGGRGQKPKGSRTVGSDDGSIANDEDIFVQKKKQQKPNEREDPGRSRMEPQIISKPHQRRRPYDSSSSSSEESKSRKRRRRRRRDSSDGNSSSDSESDEEDLRRQRLLKQRRRNRIEPEIVGQKLEPHDNSEKRTEKEATEHQKSSPSLTAQNQSKNVHDSSPKQRVRQSSSSSDNSSTNDSSDDSSSDDSSSSEEEHVTVAKPLFVPKHKRHLIQSEDQKLEQDEARQQREDERTKKRIMESRAMVAKQVAAVQAATGGGDEEEEEEAGGATNSAPNDDDDMNREEERDAWEMRELERLLTALDEVKAREAAKVEYERRRHMTDKECLEEDIRNGRYQRPGAAREQQNEGKGGQRYYHRGAYYQQADEWDESDVRHKSAEYARAATGEDKIDKSQLPDIMRVNNFGLSRQNRRYKGLAREDTSDRRVGMLPIVRQGGEKNRNSSGKN